MISVYNSPWYNEILAEGIEIGRRLSVEYGFKTGFENDYQASLPKNDWHPQSTDW